MGSLPSSGARVAVVRCRIAVICFFVCIGNEALRLL